MSVTPTDESAILAAVRWVESVLLGTVGTSLAVLAVATTGFLLLSGRVNFRRGGAVIVGCFILFGAASIARGLRDTARTEQSPPGTEQPVAPSPVNAIDRRLPEDPYAGAAVRR